MITGITKNGYVVLDGFGSERTVGCSIPGVTLNAGQSVWVKEPMGSLNDLHICGIVKKADHRDRNRIREQEHGMSRDV